MNSKKQGDIGLGKAISWYASNGYTVCIPLTDSQDYDLVVDGPEGLRRIQVKTSTHKPNDFSYAIELRVRGGNQSWNGISKKLSESNDIDEFFIFLVETNDMYIIPKEIVGGKGTINLGNQNGKYEKYKIG